ncbi:MAG: hypothetical protein ACYTEL_07420 [Planctomycetota bacterium]
MLRHGRIRGELDLAVRTSTDELKSGVTRRKSTAVVTKERLVLKTAGSLYHANLLSYGAAVGLGLTQQRLSSSDRTNQNEASLNDYDVTVNILKKKPYPIRLYTSKFEDVTARQFLGFLKTETERNGANVSLRSKDWPMRFAYSSGKSRQGALAGTADDFFDRDDEQFNYAAEHYFSRLSHLSFDFDRNITEQRTLGGSSTVKNDNYTLLHDLIFGNDEQHRLDSFFSFFRQTEPAKLDNLRWNENLLLRHSPTFKTDYEFNFADRKRESLGGQVTSQGRTVGGEAGFEHKLYESLVTTGKLLGSQSEFGGGSESVVKGGNVAFSYTKENPWGRLNSVYSVGVTQLDQSGGTRTGMVVDEPHVAASLMPVELERVNIDISSIQVKDGNGLFFQEGEDYVITEINGRVRLDIITVGGVIPPNFTEGQEFFVDYVFFVESKREEDAVRQNFTIRQRLENGLSVYYAHRRQDEEVSSTPTDITPDEFRMNRFGADYVKGGLSLSASYSETETTAIPSTARRLNGRYNWRLSPDSRAAIRATLQSLDFGEPDKRDIELFGLGAEIYCKLTNRLDMSSSIDYRDEDDSRFGITEGFQLKSELKYNYRQLRVTAGAAFSQFSRRENESEGMSFYIRLRRFF